MSRRKRKNPLTRKNDFTASRTTGNTRGIWLQNKMKNKARKTTKNDF